MRRSAPSIALASLAAGPIFLISTALAALYLHLPRPMPVAVGPGAILAIVMLLITSVIFGLALSILPNLIGSRLLFSAGIALPEMRARPVWAGTGALIGAAVAWATGAFAEPALAFGLIFTSACCAALCRHSACWD